VTIGGMTDRMSITLTNFGGNDAFVKIISASDFLDGQLNAKFDQVTAELTFTGPDTLSFAVSEFADDGSPQNAYLSLFSASDSSLQQEKQSAELFAIYHMPQNFFTSHVGTSISFSFNISAVNLSGGG
jgi:hypothetical protein